jgi:acyl carrier protein
MDIRSTILDETREILRKQLRSPDLDLPEAVKLRSLAADSLDLIEIVFVIEDHFGIDLPPPERPPATPAVAAGAEPGATPAPAPPPINDLSAAVDWTLADLVDWIATKRAEAPALAAPGTKAH